MRRAFLLLRGTLNKTLRFTRRTQPCVALTDPGRNTRWWAAFDLNTKNLEQLLALAWLYRLSTADDSGVTPMSNNESQTPGSYRHDATMIRRKRIVNAHVRNVGNWSIHCDSCATHTSIAICLHLAWRLCYSIDGLIVVLYLLQWPPRSRNRHRCFAMVNRTRRTDIIDFTIPLNAQY